MDLATWLRQWLTRHPLKEPADLDRAQYTAEVMERVKSLEPPLTTPAPAPWRMVWLRPALVTVTAAAAILLVVGRTAQPPIPVVQVAEQLSEDDLWLEETLQWLEEFDEELPEDVFEDWSDEEWLQELERLDEELFLSS